MDVPMTGLGWQPATRGVSEVFAVSFTDGSFKLVSKTGRVEKHVTDAHTGAITSIKWSHDGSTLATSGEDG
jgi:intraflagellar transport protein 80